jgi:YD repeat-containing protein
LGRAPKQLFKGLAITSLLLVHVTVACAQNATSFQYFYDDLGQLTKVIDSSGNEIDYIYDPVGNILQIRRSMAPGNGMLAILNFTPQQAAVGGTVTIIGQGFSTTTSQDLVKFNGTPATVVSATSTTLVVTVPTGATTGPISVSVGTQTVHSSTNFTVLPGNQNTFTTVQVTVYYYGTTPAPGAPVSINDANTNGFQFAGNADANGVVNIPNVPLGSFTVKAVDPIDNTINGAATGTVTPADQGKTIPVPITFEIQGTVQGTVYAADGRTPIVGADYTITDIARNKVLAQGTTDQNGFYSAQVELIANNNQGVQVEAYLPSDPNINAQGTGTLTTQGQVVVINLILSTAGIIEGTIYYYDGVTPVPNPNVFVEQTINGNPIILYGASAPNGEYQVVGAQVGAFTLTAQDFSSGLFNVVTGNVTNPAAPVQLNVNLPASGTLAGTVLDSNNNAVPSAQLGVSSFGMYFLDRFAAAGSNGSYTFNHVPAVPFSVQATQQVQTTFGSADGAITTDGQNFNQNLTLASTGTVTGTVYQSDGITPDPNANVTITNYANDVNLGIFQQTLQADGSGNYSATGIETGAVQVTASDPNNSSLVGQAEGTLSANGPLALNVTLGNAAPVNPFQLVGTDNFIYDAECSGDLMGGGTVDGFLNGAYDDAYRLELNAALYPCFPAGVPQQSNREIDFTQGALGPLTVTRKVFSPSGGRFARYLDEITNPTSAGVSVTVSVDSLLGSGTNTNIVVSPSQTSNTYAVTDANGVCCSPSLAHVFSGSNPSVPVSATQFVNGNKEIFYRWNVNVPAGQTVIFMHFAVQAGDDNSAQSEAQALVGLTDPDELDGISTTEQSEVVNFLLP